MYAWLRLWRKVKLEKTMEEGSVILVSIVWKDFSSQVIFEKIRDWNKKAGETNIRDKCILIEGRARAKTLRLNGTQCGHRFEESQRLGRSHGERNSRKKREPRPDPIVLCRTWHRLEWFISRIKYALNTDVTKTHEKRWRLSKMSNPHLLQQKVNR